jgi:hypothetical protein
MNELLGLDRAGSNRRNLHRGHNLPALAATATGHYHISAASSNCSAGFRGAFAEIDCDALHPERVRLVVLPTRRRAEGLASYAEGGAGVRLQFPMPVD